MHSQAQNLPADSWKITWNKKLILATSNSDEAGNILKIGSGDLDKNYVLEISYKEADSKKLREWNRSFMFMDESDNELLRKDSTRNTNISAADFKKLFNDRKKIKIYTVAVPNDPNLAARVRVRRVHLCTLEL
jgi:hypothetical protein